jgi:hypothetical protein
MSKKIQEKKEEQLKNDILKKEEKREYYSERFKKIEDRVKESLKLQKTDEALRDITL